MENTKHTVKIDYAFTILFERMRKNARFQKPQNQKFVNTLTRNCDQLGKQNDIRLVWK